MRMLPRTEQTIPLRPGRNDWRRIVLERVFSSSIYPLTLRGRSIDTVWPIETNTWPEETDTARALLDGTAIIAGRPMPFRRVPWVALDVGPARSRYLHGFAWISALRTLGTDESRRRARELIEGWMEVHREWSLPAWEPALLGQRLAAWLSSSDFLLADAPPGFRNAFLRSIAMQARHLARVAPYETRWSGALIAAKGVVFSALALAPERLPAALALLIREIDRQILEDGGHIERNPSVLLTSLRDLLDIRTALAGREQPIPVAIEHAILRMAPALRALRMGDGGLALFNGGREEDRRLIDAVLAQAASRARPASNLHASKYMRLSGGRTTIIVDVGGPPPAAASHAAHAGALGFEMSAGRHRVIVNCGSFDSDDPRWRLALRSTAAHSTVAIDDANIFPLLATRRAAETAMHASCRLYEADGESWLEAEHDGYLATKGVVVRRRIYLAAAGDDVRGEDILRGPAGQPVTIRFHLHPEVSVSLTRDRSAAAIQPPGGDGWRFLTTGDPITLEESTYLGKIDRPRRTRQLVLRTTTQEGETVIKWSLRATAADPPGA